MLWQDGISVFGTKGQVTPKSIVQSRWNSNPFEILCLSGLSASFIKFQVIILIWPAFGSADLPKTLCSFSPTPMMLRIKFDQDSPAGLRVIQLLWLRWATNWKWSLGVFLSHLSISSWQTSQCVHKVRFTKTRTLLKMHYYVSHI